MHLIASTVEQYWSSSQQKLMWKWYYPWLQDHFCADQGAFWNRLRRTISHSFENASPSLYLRNVMCWSVEYKRLPQLFLRNGTLDKRYEYYKQNHSPKYWWHWTLERKWVYDVRWNWSQCNTMGERAIAIAHLQSVLSFFFVATVWINDGQKCGVRHIICTSTSEQ